MGSGRDHKLGLKLGSPKAQLHYIWLGRDHKPGLKLGSPKAQLHYISERCPQGYWLCPRYIFCGNKRNKLIYESSFTFKSSKEWRHHQTSNFILSSCFYLVCSKESDLLYLCFSRPSLMSCWVVHFTDCWPRLIASWCEAEEMMPALSNKSGPWNWEWSTSFL